MQCLGFVCEVKESGQLLLSVKFDLDGRSVYWVPRWEDVRDLFEKAAFVEIQNQGGFVNSEARRFNLSAEFVHRLNLHAIEKEPTDG